MMEYVYARAGAAASGVVAALARVDG